MDGEIDLSRQQCGVDLGREEFLALDARQRRVEDAIAARLDADEFDMQSGVEPFEHVRDGTALRPCQQGTAGAEP